MGAVIALTTDESTVPGNLVRFPSPALGVLPMLPGLLAIDRGHALLLDGGS